MKTHLISAKVESQFQDFQKVLEMACVYVLQCADDCWYIGVTKDFSRRLSEHLRHYNGSRWTRKHRPLSVHEIIEVNTDQKYALEDAKTLEYIHRYGIEKVRGGSYCISKNRRKFLREQGGSLGDSRL